MDDAVPLSENGLEANFGINRWDDVGGNWGANVDGSGTGAGVVPSVTPTPQ